MKWHKKILERMLERKILLVDENTTINICKNCGHDIVKNKGEWYHIFEIFSEIHGKDIVTAIITDKGCAGPCMCKKPA